MRYDLASQHGQSDRAPEKDTNSLNSSHDILNTTRSEKTKDLESPSWSSIAPSPETRSRSGLFRQSISLRSRRTAILGLILVAVACFQTFRHLKPPAQAIRSINTSTIDSKTAAWHASNSSDGALNLAQLYPALEDGASKECQTAWEEVAANISCHRDVLSLATFDDRNATKVMTAGLDPLTASLNTCDSDCTMSVPNFVRAMRSHCRGRADRFNLTHYDENGIAYFNKSDIEAGPLYTAHALDVRVRSLCYENMYSSEADYCSATLWSTWNIVIGNELLYKIPVKLSNVYQFLEHTNNKSILPPARSAHWSWNLNGTVAATEVQLPSRQVGPGHGETQCDWCTELWLQRTLERFEVGIILDPRTGQAMSRRAFYELLEKAILRCATGKTGSGGDRMLREARAKWARLGWWCGDQPCEEGDILREEARKALHGLDQDDAPLPEIRAQMQEKNAPVKALQTLHDSLHALPCSIWFTRETAIQHIMPHNYLISLICTQYCAEAVYEVNLKHYDDFAAAARALPDGNVFQTWTAAYQQFSYLCAHTLTIPGTLTRPRTTRCAPGYAALGCPEWLFDWNRPSRVEILAALGPAVDALNATLPPYDVQVSYDLVPQLMAESVVNDCVRALLIGDLASPTRNARIDEFLNDEAINSKEYSRVVKSFLRLWGMFQMTEGEWYHQTGWEWETSWGAMGLDDHD